MGEVKIPLSVVEKLLDQQAKVFEAQLALLNEHLTRNAILFERAMNPPIPPGQPNDEAVDFLTANPRMSEEEEDLRYAFAVGDLTKSQLDDRLSNLLDNTYIERE